jgi:membrane-associated phospholipid phosphatase
VAPPLRFLWHRVTPGELGLELSTAVAVAGVGIFVFVLYVVELSNDLGPTPLDTELLDLADQLYNAALADVAKVVSAFGSLVAVLIVVVSTVLLVAAYRRWTEAIVLVVGSGLIYAAVHIAKAGIDRPRPPDPLVETSLSSFPSGHAAYATAYIAVALILTRRLGIVANAALVTIAIVLAAAVGLSRIYLRAHYWSDVAAGWGIGCGIFASLVAIAMIVNYVRHNGRRREPQPPLARAEP